MVDRKMERARRIGGIGTVFSLMFFIPVVGWIIGLIGLVLLFFSCTGNC
ncbi:hypothetical protein [Coprothermobacter platensis]|nr:hypothetical protein [Coprothermobacter platensis]